MRDAIDRAVGAGELDELVNLLNDAETSDLQYAARRLASTNGDIPPFRKMDKLATTDSVAARIIACHLARPAFAEDQDATLASLRKLADDMDSSVRAAACTACGHLLRRDFVPVLERLRAWITHESSEVRRAVVVAASRTSRHDRPEWGEPLLRLLEPLVIDRDPGVRRSLGPAAIATNLLADYPMIAFEYVVKWSTLQDEQALWNVAMSFSGPAAAPIVKKALIVLRKLSLDERRYVWRAVSSAMWKLGRRRPDIVRPELGRWLEDERRIDVARAALEHI